MKCLCPVPSCPSRNRMRPPFVRNRRQRCQSKPALPPWRLSFTKADNTQTILSCSSTWPWYVLYSVVWCGVVWSGVEVCIVVLGGWASCGFFFVCVSSLVLPQQTIPHATPTSYTPYQTMHIISYTPYHTSPYSHHTISHPYHTTPHTTPYHTTPHHTVSPNASSSNALLLSPFLLLFLCFASRKTRGASRTSQQYCTVCAVCLCACACVFVCVCVCVYVCVCVFVPRSLSLSLSHSFCLLLLLLCKIVLFFSPSTYILESIESRKHQDKHKAQR